MWKFTKNKKKKWLQDFLFNFFCYIYIFCSFSKRFEKNSRIFTEKQKFPYLLNQKNKIVLKSTHTHTEAIVILKEVKKQT
jgi:hypothetical protein